MREIVLDTETTGLDPLADRLVEIGCVELINHIPTGRQFHRYLRPDRPMSADAQRVHGLTDAFLADKPAFATVAEDFLTFLDGAAVVAHNAEFDFGFVNAELERIGLPTLEPGRMVDTLMLARRRHPAGPNSLDALCSRYGIDASRRVLHGALLDATLLAEVYVELRGGRQATLGLIHAASGDGAVVSTTFRVVGPRTEALPSAIGAAELAAHAAFVGELGRTPLWRDYLAEAGVQAGRVAPG